MKKYHLLLNLKNSPFIIPNFNLFHLLFTAIVVLSACKSKSKNISENALEIPIDLNASFNGDYSDIFSSIEYKLLDDPESNLLVNPYKFIFSQNRIYVQDIGIENLHVFNDHGDHVFSINSEGQGPSEFTRIEDFQVASNSIFIFDKYLGKILEYNLKGKFLKESKAVNYGTGFFKKGNKTLMYMDNRKDLSRFNFLLTDSTTVLQENFAIRKGFEKESQLLKNSFSESPFDSSLYFNIPFSYEVAFFNQDLNFKRKLKFNLGKYEIDDEFRSSFFGSRDRSEYDLIRKERALVEKLSGFFDLGKFHFLSLQQGGDKLHYIFLDRDFKVLYQSDKLNNDIDGMKIRGIPWTSTNDKILILVNSINFYNNYLETFSGKKITLEPNNVHGFFEANKEKLREDKTVLVLLKVRNQIEVQ